MQYWLKLSSPEKESLLSVAKHFVELKQDADSISIELYNTEIDEAMARMDKAGSFTHGEAVRISKSRLNIASVNSKNP